MTNSGKAGKAIRVGEKMTNVLKKRSTIQVKRLFSDSEWARTTDLYPVKVALSQLSYGIVIFLTALFTIQYFFISCKGYFLFFWTKYYSLLFSTLEINRSS